MYPQNSILESKQMQTALKRGVAYGILKKNGGHYILPTNGDIKCQEIAEQEVNLLDACRRSRMQRKMGCKCKKKGRRRGRKRRFCRCKPRRRVRRRRAARGGCRTRRRRRRSRSRRRRRRKCPCGGTGRSGNLDRLKRAPASEPFDKFCTRKSLEGYDSAVSEKSSLSSVSSME